MGRGGTARIGFLSDRASGRHTSTGARERLTPTTLRLPSRRRAALSAPFLAAPGNVGLLSCGREPSLFKRPSCQDREWHAERRRACCSSMAPGSDPSRTRAPRFFYGSGDTNTATDGTPLIRYGDHVCSQSADFGRIGYVDHFQANAEMPAMEVVLTVSGQERTARPLTWIGLLPKIRCFVLCGR